MSVDELDPKRHNQSKAKSLFWIGSCKRDLLEMPEAVRSEVGYALYLAQIGYKHAAAKPLKGFGSAGILEVVEDFDGEAYRAIYTVRFSNAVYVLHCFQKKSTRGIAMPKPDAELIQIRLTAAEQHSRGKRNDQG